jgi:hypothetical protein
MSVAGAPDPVHIQELRGPCWILESWSLSERARRKWWGQIPSGAPIPLEDYAREQMDEAKRVEAAVGVEGLQEKHREDGVVELGKQAWAGGRVLAWRADDGIWVEDTTYGSGVAVASSQRLKVVPEFTNHLDVGNLYAVPFTTPDKIEDVVLRAALRALPYHQAISIEWKGDKIRRGPHGAIIKVVSVERSTGEVRPVRVSGVCEVVRGL